MDRANWHITLAFLGEVEDSILETLGPALERTAAEFEPFPLRLEGLGAFPNPGRPRVLWVGATGPGVETLKALHGAVARAAKECGCPPEDDRFSPHVTLARFKPGRGPSPDLRPLVARHKEWSAGSLEVARIVLFASRLGPQGPSYSPLAVAPLGRGKTSVSALT